MTRVARMLTVTATTETTTAISASTAAAAITGHLVQSRVNLLLSFLENRDQITSLFGVCGYC